MVSVFCALHTCIYYHYYSEHIPTQNQGEENRDLFGASSSFLQFETAVEVRRAWLTQTIELRIITETDAAK